MATPAPQPTTPRVAPPGGVDPAVKMPKGVREAAARSAELFAQQNGEQPATPPAEPVNPDTITISDAPIATPPATPPAAATPATPATPPAPAATEGDNVSRADFNAMKGRFEKANANNIRLSEEINNLRNVVTQLSTAAAAAPPAPTPPELRPASLITPQEEADYGADFLDVVARKAREIAGTEIAGLKKQIDELTNGVRATTQITAQTARDQLLAKLTEEVPNWQTMNNDPDFLQWLGLPDTFSGAIRHELLKQAFDQNNTARVLAFFKGFLSEEAATAPVIPAPPPVVPTLKVPLETFAAPGRAKSAAPTPPAEKPIITRAQVTQFYLDVAAGKYRGREAEKLQNETAIFAATNEGRLR